MEKKRIVIIAVVALIMILIIILLTKGKTNKDSIIDNNIEVSTVTKEEAKDSAINNIINKLERANVTVTKGEPIISGEIQGYTCTVNNERIEIYYCERAKISTMIESGSMNGEAKINFNGLKEDALIYNNIIILKCESTETKEIIQNTLKTK